MNSRTKVLGFGALAVAAAGAIVVVNSAAGFGRTQSSSDPAAGTGTPARPPWRR